MSRSSGSEVKADPNLTPILDMVFQLITFFMLVINFKSAELDLTLSLPVVGSARPREYPSGQQILVLNVKDLNGKPALTVYQHPLLENQILGYIKGEAQSSRLAAHLTEDDVQMQGKEIPCIVVIRADEGCPFGHVNFVVDACQREGFRQFALRATGSRK